MGKIGRSGVPLEELRIVVADDSAPIREQIDRAFSQVDGCNLIGMAADGCEALNMVRSLRPDVLVLDVSMPRRSGVQVLREIREEDPATVIIMFTADPSNVLKEICLDAGANFYLDKTQLNELVDICLGQRSAR
jgi:DNA-binding NarL/FixJ family response regulator